MTDGVTTYSRGAKVLLLDVLLLAFIYLVPTLAHLSAYPIYYFDPMRTALFVSVFLLNVRRNAYFLAVTLPLFSFFVAGHPVAVKNVIMAIELLINVWFLYLLLDKKINSFVSCFLSIFVSKTLYYIMKYVVIWVGLMNHQVIETNVLIQIGITVFLSLIFWLVYRKSNA